MPTASVTGARRSQAGISAAHRSACSAWPVPLPDPAAALVAVGLACLAAGAPLDPQACREPHYRWTLKTDSALAAVAPVVTSVSAILSDWAPPNLGARDRCAHRSERELLTYSVTAWVRRGAKFKDDQDWPIQRTNRGARPPRSCTVLQNPPPPTNPPPSPP